MVHNIEAIKRVHSPKYVTQLLPYISFHKLLAAGMQWVSYEALLFPSLSMNCLINILCQEDEEWGEGTPGLVIEMVLHQSCYGSSSLAWLLGGN